VAPDQIAYLHCDVFTDAPFSGTSLAVFPNAQYLDHAQMLLLTQELRHFESVFVQQEAGQTFLRISAESKELRFAGNPVMGAAAVLYSAIGDMQQTQSFGLSGGRRIEVRPRRQGGTIRVTMG